MSSPITTPPEQRPPPPSTAPTPPPIQNSPVGRTVKAIKSANIEQSEGATEPKVLKSAEITLRQGVHVAKNLERGEVAKALRESAETVRMQEIPPAPTAEERKMKLKGQIIATLQRQCARTSFNFESKKGALLNALQANGFDDPNFKLSDLSKIIDEVMGSLTDAHDNMMRDLKPALEASALQQKKFAHEYTSLTSTLKEIELLATNESPKNLEAHNQEILFLMRKALQNPAYQLMKHDEEHPAVKMIHGLCLASYAKPEVLHAFHELGSSLQKLVPDTVGKGLHEQLKSSRDEGYKHGLLKNDKTRQYITTYFKQVVGAFFSTKLGTKLAGIFGKAYDPRGELGNNAGALYKEKMTIGGEKVTLRTVYTPSPTIGDNVSPEARGILQAMENRSLMSKERLQEDPYRYVVWNYTNLQNLSSPDEGPRAKNIMLLNEEFPLSFRGITIPADSTFYRAGVHGNNEAKIQAAIHDKTPLNQSYKALQLAELTQDDNFTLESRRQHPGGGYYFPISKTDEQKKWKEECALIVDRAYDIVLVKKNQKPANVTDKQWNWYQKAAFRELVMLGIVKYSQQITAQSVLQSKNGGKILVTNACKENIDRGGKTNAAFLWALGGEKNDVFAAFHARALLGRFRLVLPDRVEPMYALTMVVPQKEAQNFLNATGPKLELSNEED